jgi:hypothetical protein
VAGLRDVDEMYIFGVEHGELSSAIAAVEDNPD